MLKWEVQKNKSDNTNLYFLKFGLEVLDVSCFIDSNLFKEQHLGEESIFSATDFEKYTFISLINNFSTLDAARIMASGMYTYDRSSKYSFLLNVPATSICKPNRTPCKGKLLLQSGTANCMAVSRNDSFLTCVLTDYHTFNIPGNIFELDQIEQYTRIDVRETLFISSR